jgi:hypothetical protein
MSSLISVIAGSRRRLDPDALAYFSRITAAGSSITDGNKLAVDAFIKGCKTDGIWSAIKASCLLAGPDTLAGALVPLVGTAPTNAGFLDADYNKTTGLIGNGSSKRLDSNRANDADPIDNNHNAAYMSSGVPNNTSAAVMGNGDATITGTNSILRLNGNVVVRSRGSSVNSTNALMPNATTGFIGHTRGPSVVIPNAYYRFSGLDRSISYAASTPFNENISIFSRGSASRNFYTGRLAFYSIGESLNLSLLDARLVTYMSSLT